MQFPLIPPTHETSYLTPRKAAGPAEVASGNATPLIGQDRAAISDAARANRDEDQRRDRDHQLSDGEKQEVRRLQARDREVRAHEQAHKSAAGNLAAGSPTFEYTTGPDGRRYATGGEVAISVREGRTPEETQRNAERVQRAAVAPHNPSAQDRQVAAAAAQKARDASAQVAEERSEKDDATSRDGAPTRSSLDLLA